jgi:DNA polymerase-3 subunit beta
MKATVERNELNSALNIAAAASSVRAALPVLTSIRIEAKGSSLTLTGCDGEMWGEASAPSNVESEGAVCVQQRLLSDIVSKLGMGEVSLELVGTTVFVRHQHSEFKMMALPAEEFPEAPEVEASSTLSLPYGELTNAISGVEFACSDDAARAVLTGVLFHYDGTTLTLVATDTHRLAVDRVHRDGIGSPLTAIVPNKALKIIGHLPIEGDENLTVSFDGTRLLVDIGTAKVVSQLLTGQYPNWERVVPSEHTRSWLINRSEFIENIDRAMILARDSANRIRFTGSGETIVISARSEDKGEAKEEVSCVSKNGDLEIAFNGRYLMEALQAMGSEGIQTEMTEASRPAIIRPTEGGDDHFCVVMPMAIG